MPAFRRQVAIGAPISKPKTAVAATIPGNSLRIAWPRALMFLAISEIASSISRSTILAMGSHPFTMATALCGSELPKPTDGLQQRSHCAHPARFPADCAPLSAGRAEGMTGMRPSLSFSGPELDGCLAPIPAARFVSLRSSKRTSTVAAGARAWVWGRAGGSLAGLGDGYRAEISRSTWNRRGINAQAAVATASSPSARRR